MNHYADSFSCVYIVFSSDNEIANLKSQAVSELLNANTSSLLAKVSMSLRDSYLQFLRSLNCLITDKMIDSL